MWTVVLYAVAGPFLIYLLFALRLTLTTGTFNGIIFYGQTANVGILNMLSAYNGNNGVLKNILIALLSFLNLGLGFISSMILQWNEWVIESWSHISVLTLFTDNSCFSLRLSNRIADFSVQILVTVVHLSFRWLLGTIINTFTPGKVFTTNIMLVHISFSNHHITTIVNPLLLTTLCSLLIFAGPIQCTRVNALKEMVPLIQAFFNLFSI